jgi:hypothetical protein
MTSTPTGDQRPDQRAVLVADLDGEPLTVLSVLEELLRDLAAWEESDAVDPPETREALRLPAPLAGGWRWPRCGGWPTRSSRPSAPAPSGAGC